MSKSAITLDDLAQIRYPFLCDVVNFEIIRSDTLANTLHIRGDRLCQFDVKLPISPYSITQLFFEGWRNDTSGHISFNSPPEDRARRTFWQQKDLLVQTQDELTWKKIKSG